MSAVQKKFWEDKLKTYKLGENRGRNTNWLAYGHNYRDSSHRSMADALLVKPNDPQAQTEIPEGDYVAGYDAAGERGKGHGPYEDESTASTSLPPIEGYNSHIVFPSLHRDAIGTVYIDVTAKVLATRVAEIDSEVAAVMYQEMHPKWWKGAR